MYPTLNNSFLHQHKLTITQAKTKLGYEYTTQVVSPSSISLVPILRSGLGMLDGLSSKLKTPQTIANSLQQYKLSSLIPSQFTTSDSSANPQLSSPSNTTIIFPTRDLSLPRPQTHPTQVPLSSQSFSIL
jgi:hypothetical protein